MTPSPAATPAGLHSAYPAPAALDGDAELVREMLVGSRRAWRTFHARYDRLICRCIARVTSRFARTLSPDDVGEICATLRMQLCANDMSKLRSFDERRGRRLSSWIGLLAVNCAYDHLRSVRNEPGRASLEECAEMPGEAPQPDELVEMKQRARLVHEILADFSDKDREFVALYFGEGLDVEQIAARMQISVKTVYSKKHKIQSRIEARLSQGVPHAERGARWTGTARLAA